MVDTLESFKNIVFLAPGALIDAELELVLKETHPYDPHKGYVPAYKFKMVNTETGVVMGNIDLRVGLTEKLKEYGGHIGYEVGEQFRGNRYAGRSCKLLFPLLRRLEINPVVITCDPENLPSRRTIESLGAKLVGSKLIEIEPGVHRMTSVYHLYL